MNSSNNLANLIAAISALISFSTLFFYLKDRRQQKHSILRDYLNGLLGWHSETVTILIKLQVLTQKNKSIDEFHALLSAQIEKGRFFFPNIDKQDNFGKEKPKAYQGYRNLVLDFLVYSYDLYLKSQPVKYLEHANRLQREFTSLVWEIVAPGKNLNEIHKLTDRYLVQEKTFEDYLKSDPNSYEFFYDS
ncbi:hypothetical protein [Leptospira wolffii]|uniref:hypothetical protein n=1 Tax=Leptospira wolffii TaxID=409998 RepID=UPI00058D8E5F|nr:hypothetical protein [Leptospira wolffii]